MSTTVATDGATERITRCDGLSWDRTVHRALVHKHALDEVFVTGWRCEQDRTWLAGVLPRANVLYNESVDEPGPPDLALVTELCRQSCFVVAHTRYDVPIVGNTLQFLLQDIEARFVDGGTPTSGGPTELLLECVVEETRRRSSELSALVWHFTVTDRERTAVVADVRMRMVWIERTDWRRMRDSMRRGRGLPTHAATPRGASFVPPAEVGRHVPGNVALRRRRTTDDETFGLARINMAHPVLFDHSIDHVFAMVQLECCRQLAAAASGRAAGRSPGESELRAFRASFASVAETDRDLEIAGPAPTLGDEGYRHELTLVQDGRVVSHFDVTTRLRTRP